MASSSASHSAAAGASSSAGSSTYEVLAHNHKASCWSFFEKIRIIETGVEKAKCKQCGALLGTGGNSSLNRHILSCSSKSAPEQSQAQISQTGYAWSYDQQLQRELQMKCVISRGLPFNTFDNERMTSYIQQGLQPKYQKVSRTTIRRDALKCYLKAKKELVAQFQKFNGRFSLTSDVWTSGLNLGISYICITCHWIDENWDMQKRIICFETFEHPHTGQSISQVIMNCTNDFKIKDRIMSISFDNASNNTSAISILQNNIDPMLNGIFFHVRCFCHILNLIVQSALENEYLKSIISKIKSMLVFIYSSSRRRQDFKKFVHSKGEKFLKPEFDMPVRWNSTFKMLDRALRQKNILMEFYLLTNTNLENNIISHVDWEIIENLIVILRVFYDATRTLSGIYYPTSDKVLGSILVFTLVFKEYRDHSFWQNIILDMETKLLKYYRMTSPIFACAAALNPMISVQGVENILEDIASNLGLDLDLFENQYISVSTFNTAFTSFYSHYESIYGISSRALDTSSSSSSSFRFQPGSATDAIMYSAARKKSKTIGGLNELAIYTQTDFALILSQDSSSFNILQWWNKNSRQFPVMAAMARDALTVQASTVASESAFSTSGRVLNERRSRLSPQAMEICICYKDYLDAAERKQDVNAIEDSSEELEDEMLEVTEDED